MAKNLIKKIILGGELVSSPVGVFFQELGLELHQTYTEGQDYEFIVDDACPEVVKLPRLQIKADLPATLKPFVRSKISNEMFASEQGRKLLKSYFHDGQEFDLVDRYSKDLKEIYTVKIHDYLNLGFFVDSIIVEAYKAQFDIEAIRSYLNTVLKFAFKKVEKNKEFQPINVSYSHNGEAFTIEVSLAADNYKGKPELESVFEEITSQSNYFDSTYFHKKKKLMLSGLFFKNPDLKTARAYFFTEIASRSAEVEETQTELHSGLVVKENVSYEATPKPEMDQETKFALARKFALFIRNYRKNEDNPIPAAKLEVNDVIHYLGHYPRQEALQDVDGEVKNLIFKLLKDDNLFNGIDEYVEKVSTSNLDSQVDEIQKVLGSKTLNDIEDIMVIKGGSRDENDAIRVKGWAENTPELQKISGGKSDGMSDNDIWEMRKQQLNVKIQDEAVRVKSEGRNIIRDDIVRVMAKELSASEQDVKVVVGGIVEEAVTNEVLNAKKLEEEFAAKILTAQVSQDLMKEKLESQVARMKKIMDQMKKEILRLQAEKDEGLKNPAPIAGIDPLEFAKVKTTLGRSMEALKAKEKALEKVKFDSESAVKHRDLKIDFLEQRIEELKVEHVRSREFANEEKLDKLEAENKSLLARLDLANKKVNIISENLEQRESEAQGKRDKEADTMKGNMQLAQSMIEGLKQEKIGLESRLSIEKEAVKKLKEEKGAKGNDEEKDGIIQVLSSEKKVAEEKFRAQAIELKKVEQKLKYTLSQLETSNKKKPAGAAQKSADIVTKQFEQAKIQLNESIAEVAEKRRELVKIKQENSQLSAKIADLEKKLANLEKKVA